MVKNKYKSGGGGAEGVNVKGLLQLSNFLFEEADRWNPFSNHPLLCKSYMDNTACLVSKEVVQ